MGIIIFYVLFFRVIMSHIVVISDGLHSSDSVCQLLQQAGHQVNYLNDDESACHYLHHNAADLVVVDVQGSFSATRQLIHSLSESFTLPILLLTSDIDEEDALDFIQAGADQYLVKPFSNKALIVFVDALIRRIALENKRLRFQHCTQQLSAKISRLPLTETEMQLTQFLTKNDGAIVSKATLQKEVLKKEICAFDRNLDVHISNIRRKMLNAGLSKLLIKTVHGKGYTFCGNLTNFSCALFFLL